MLEKRVIASDLSIRYYQGSAFAPENALVFLHGWNSEAIHLKTIFSGLDNFIAMDLPGFGQSQQPEIPWSISEYAEFLENFLNKLGVKNPILIGHSFGGSIIIKYLANGKPARKIILISSAGIRIKGFRIYFYNIIAKIFKIFFFLPFLNLLREKLRKKLYKFIDSEDYLEAGNLTESYKKIIRENLSDEIKKVKAPAILIWGENDSATPLQQGITMHRLMDNSKLFIIKNAGHFSFLDQSKKFNDIFSKEINAT